ncbi:MAG: SAM-dependent DNA methyltransferase [Proteobacteria bacterium]|nr:MAG: SAM-dependent DNA methyltransferase [Pseudomonadota bacterium]
MKAVEKSSESEILVRSKKRVSDHGEVFTPSWLVESMLDLIQEQDRIGARVLEPACGNGNFLVRVLNRKLELVELKSKRSTFEKRYLALFAVMSIYGIELLEDNVLECRKRIIDIFANYLKLNSSDELFRVASYVARLNIVQGDALEMTTKDDRPIVFSEWEHIGKDKFCRRDYRMDFLAQGSEVKATSVEPIKVYEDLTVEEMMWSKSTRLQKVS